MTNVNKQYCDILRTVLQDGDIIESRNHSVHSHILMPAIVFEAFPLVTVRKTAWKMALREMEWFLSGDTRCPDELLAWWDGQLDPEQRYQFGYSHQLRHFDKGRLGAFGLKDGFDQVESFIDNIIDDPLSRRHIMTTWNPFDMDHITLANENKKCIATCHGTIVQGFVRNDTLSLTVYQRSADLLLGVPHNWVQWWGFLLWAAHQTDLGVGSLRWVFGDAHIYLDQSHLDTVKAILDSDKQHADVTLCYDPTTAAFKADDFQVMGDIPEPVTRLRPIRF